MIIKIEYKRLLKFKNRFFIGVIIACLAALSEPSFAEIKQPRTLSPELATLEASIIDETKHLENLFYKSGALYDDADVLAYINSVNKKIVTDPNAGETAQTSVKIIREPTVNAFALGTGSIYVHTGALARLENEAQLFFLLGHENSHILNKDIVYHTHSYHNKTIFFKLLDIALAPTSVFFGILGDLTQMASFLFYATTVTGYSRIIEARSDEDSMLWTQGCGYSPRDGANLIRIFINETERYQTGPEIFFLMSHPTNKWRSDTLNKMIAGADGKKDEDGGRVGSEEFLQNMTKIKLYNATLNIKWDRLEHARDNIEWVLEKSPNNAEAHYLAGEIYRLEAEDKDRLKYELNYKKWTELNKKQKKGELEDVWRKKAMEEYAIAIGCDPKYANSYKGMALLYNNKKDKENSLLNLSKYLEIDPNAPDKRFVNSLIERLNRPEPEKKKK